jgi:hypothetical protein
MNKDESSHYRRGQVFGFTIAEILTLLLFVLLLALMTKIIKSEEKEKEALKKLDLTERHHRVIIEQMNKKSASDGEVFIIKEELAKQQEQLDKDHLNFKKLERILLASGEEIFKAKDDKEKIKKMREALELGGLMTEAGLDKNTSVEELDTLVNLQKELKDPKNKDKSLMQLLQDELELLKIEDKNKTAYTDARIKNLAGGDNALVPCWVDSGEYDLARRGMPISLYNFHVEQNGFRVEKAYKTLDDKMYAEIVRNHEIHIGKVYSYSKIGYTQFTSDFKGLEKEEMLKSVGTKCVFSIRPFDYDPNVSKARYKNSIWTGTKIFEKISTMKEIWGFD